MVLRSRGNCATRQAPTSLHTANSFHTADSIPFFLISQVVSCNWHRRQTLAISSDSDVDGYFVIEYMGFRSEKVSHWLSATKVRLE